MPFELGGTRGSQACKRVSGRLLRKSEQADLQAEAVFVVSDDFLERGANAHVRADEEMPLDDLLGAVVVREGAAVHERANGLSKRQT